MSLEQASEIQRKMYDFIINYMKSEGMPPTNREIGRELNIPSTGHVDYHLTMLEKKGWILRQPKKSRGINLMKQTPGIPVKGCIAAGEPLDIFSDTMESLDMDLADGENSYALVVRGSSMIEDHIYDGDYVMIKPQTTCQNGDIVVAVHIQEGIEGSATIKRIFQEKEHDRVRLQPANSELDPILISKSVWDREWQVQGKVVAIFRQYGISTKSTASQSTGTENSTRINTDNSLGAMREASDRLSELIKQKTTALPSSDLPHDKSNEKSEDTGILAEKQLKPLIPDRDEEIVKTVQKVVNLAEQQDAAYERITTAAKNTHEHLNQIYDQGQHQAKQWFQLGLVAAIIGFLVIISGAIVAMLTINIAGVLTSIASIIPSTIAALFFQQAKEANKRLDDFYGKLVEVEEINRAMELSLTTSDDIQDRYKGLIIFRLLGLHTTGQEIPILELVTKSHEVNRLTLIKESSKETK